MKLDIEVTNKVTPTVNSIVNKSPDRMYKAVMKGGGIVKTEAASRARSRKIANSLKVIGKNSDDGPEAYTGFSKKGKGWYGKFFESGAKEHEIESKNGKVLAWVTASGGKAEFTSRTGTKRMIKYYVAKNGQHTFDKSEEGKTFYKVVHHPGMKQDQILDPSYKNKKPEIQEVIFDATIKTALEAIKENGG